MPGILSQCDVRFLPIVAAFVKTIGVAEEIDRICAGESRLKPGLAVSAMILDVLSGRSPLYRFEEFVSGLDLELLLGEAADADKFNDDALGRVLLRLYDAGTGRIFSAIALKVAQLFDLDTSHVHHDTTTHTMHGDYDRYHESDQDLPFVITHGFNKDHRPDLKQIVHSLLCVDHGIPISRKMVDGNKSDKTVNEDLLRRITEQMSELGVRDFLYVADCALVTETNLRLMNDPKKGCRFVTKLPETYGECVAAIERAMDADTWEEIGPLSMQPPTKRRKPACYRVIETFVTLHGVVYRALVIHSDALDKRKTKQLSKRLADDLAETTKIKIEGEKISYACMADAQAALERLAQGKFHRLRGEVYEKVTYAKGRPKADGSRKVASVTYRLRLEALCDEAAVARAQKKAGCFVLLSNTSAEDSTPESALSLLFAYKDQGYVERNFGFLKNPLIVEALAKVFFLEVVLVVLKKSRHEKSHDTVRWIKRRHVSGDARDAYSITIMVEANAARHSISSIGGVLEDPFDGQGTAACVHS
jgi:transposase